MRPVHIKGIPPQDWLDEADAVTQQLHQFSKITITGDKYDLLLLPDIESTIDLPESGTNLVVVGKISERIHVRLFNDSGTNVMTVSEPDRASDTNLLYKLKELLGEIGNWSLSSLRPIEKRLIFEALTLVVRRFFISSTINRHESLWTDHRIRDWLLAQFNNKCWYSEAQESVSSIHVDHYRPKGRLKEEPGGITTEGYWWLAFVWTNYRICGQRLNTKKGDLFPYSDAVRSNEKNDPSLDLESPMLIDPCTTQTRLISYEKEDEETCVAVVAGGVDPDEARCAQTTIDILGLNRLPQLNSKRSDFWDQCMTFIKEYKEAVGPTPLKTVARASAKSKLKQMIMYEAEFSSVAEACIHKYAPEPLKADVFDPVTSSPN